MPTYVLWNKKDKRIFKHPRYGIWSSESRQEVEEALLDLKEALDDVGMGHLKKYLHIADYEEVKELTSN
jgi:hypothetical protein